MAFLRAWLWLVGYLETYILWAYISEKKRGKLRTYVSCRGNCVVFKNPIILVVWNYKHSSTNVAGMLKSRCYWNDGDFMITIFVKIVTIPVINYLSGIDATISWNILDFDFALKTIAYFLSDWFFQKNLKLIVFLIVCDLDTESYHNYRDEQEITSQCLLTTITHYTQVIINNLPPLQTVYTTDFLS